MAGDKQNVLSISMLDIGALAQLKQHIEQELDFFSTSLQQLKSAQTKFQESEVCLDMLKPSCEGKDILVPLTSSMYVPGRLVDVNKVTVDIGTGYYVEKDVSASKDYFKRRVKYITDQMEKIQKVAQEKVALREAIVETMDKKIQATFAAQAAAAAPKS
ncbi:prefoldin subunit 5-like [Dermacentor andersoni]|uniref:prefoldin subunit 5-like n=1 Tax=Dermacentor andersoni TaxID=34620 RepID=UPI002155D7AC|nr:prefoldin subunit 5-like [Dermacentor andersoni]